MTTMHSGTLPSHPGHGANHISLREPLHWVSLGLRDLRRARSVGIAYGLMVAVLGWLVFTLGNHPYFIAAAVSGFLLLGPILGAGLIEASRAMEAGDTPTFDTSLRGLNRNRPALERFALTLLALAAVWLVVSTLVLNATLGPIAPDVERTLWDNALPMMSSSQWLAWAAIGGVLAVLSFSISVIAVPLMLDKHASAGDAMRGSLRAVARHPVASAEWALLIVLLTAVGIATALLGLIVIYPILGHASWHAYQALRDQDDLQG
ncbi:MAG TPA: DUF2189 domain-containing protein [Lysobacter sp.]|nr:DUF2189 domain-containing protein [Lysobacter sp.]